MPRPRIKMCPRCDRKREKLPNRSYCRLCHNIKANEDYVSLQGAISESKKQPKEKKLNLEISRKERKKMGNKKTFYDDLDARFKSKGKRPDFWSGDWDAGFTPDRRQKHLRSRS